MNCSAWVYKNCLIVSEKEDYLRPVKTSEISLYYANFFIPSCFLRDQKEYLGGGLNSLVNSSSSGLAALLLTQNNIKFPHLTLTSKVTFDYFISIYLKVHFSCTHIFRTQPVSDFCGQFFYIKFWKTKFHISRYWENIYTDISVTGQYQVPIHLSGFYIYINTVCEWRSIFIWFLWVFHGNVDLSDQFQERLWLAVSTFSLCAMQCGTHIGLGLDSVSTPQSLCLDSVSILDLGLVGLLGIRQIPVYVSDTKREGCNHYRSYTVCAVCSFV